MLMRKDRWVEVVELCESVEAKCRCVNEEGTFCMDVRPESKGSRIIQVG